VNVVPPRDYGGEQRLGRRKGVSQP
jgi:hypothetical protein